MKQACEQRSENQRGKHRSLATTTTSNLGSAQPGDGLGQHDHAEDTNEQSHRGKGIAALLGVLALLWGSQAWAAPEDAAPQALTVGFAILLGAIQGASEFLPVSSSGHLSLGQAWLDIDPESAGHRFNIVLHAGTLIAVFWVYRSDVFALIRVLTRPTQDTADRRRLLMMLLASLPLGIALIPAVEGLVIAMESQVRLVGLALIVTAAILFFAFREGRGEGEGSDEPPTAKQAILIGLAQVCAVLPGISRSGSTIAAGLAVGLDRTRAARFSFLISLIAVGGATAKEMLDILTEDGGSGSIEVVPFAAGFISSLVVGLLSLRGLLYLVGKGRVQGFVIYLLIMGTVAIAVG